MILVQIVPLRCAGCDQRFVSRVRILFCHRNRFTEGSIHTPPSLSLSVCLSVSPFPLPSLSPPRSPSLPPFLPLCLSVCLSFSRSVPHCHFFLGRLTSKLVQKQQHVGRFFLRDMVARVIMSFPGSSTLEIRTGNLSTSVTLWTPLQAECLYTT